MARKADIAQETEKVLAPFLRAVYNRQIEEKACKEIAEYAVRRLPARIQPA
jgi:hypothetical protein